MRISGIARALVVAAGVVSLAACEYSPDTTERTIEYNQAVAQSTNDLFLLNAVRASKRNPTYYTRLLSNLASTTVTPGLSSIIPWGSSKQLTVGPNSAGSIVATSVVAKAAATITPGLTMAAQNQLSLQNLDDQLSMNGLLSPITLQQISNYRTEGFSPEQLDLLYMGSISISSSILTHLPDAVAEACKQKPNSSSDCQLFFAHFLGACFGRTDVPAASRSPQSRASGADTGSTLPPIVVFPNDPAIDGIPTNTPHDMRYFTCFKQVLTALLALDLSPTPAPYKLLYRLPYDLARGNPRYFADLTQQSLELAVDPSQKWVGVCKKPDSPTLSITANDSVKRLLGLTSDPALVTADHVSGTDHENPISVATPQDTTKNDCPTALEKAIKDGARTAMQAAQTPSKAMIAYVPRSLEGIVYFLGQIVRRKFDERTSRLGAVTFWNAADGEHPYDEELFLVEKGALSLDSIATASNSGEHYFIPPLCPNDALGRAPEGCSDEFPDHASAQILTMLNQLWGLNKTATAPPVISSVTVISPP